MLQQHPKREQVLQPNVTAQAPFDEQKRQRGYESHDPRRLAALYPTNQTTRQHQPFRQSNSQRRLIMEHSKRWIFEASRCKTRIKKGDKLTIIKAWKKQPKIQSRGSRVQKGGAQSIPVEPLKRSGASERRRRRDAKIHQAAHFLPPCFLTHPVLRYRSLFWSLLRRSAKKKGC